MQKLGYTAFLHIGPPIALAECGKSGSVSLGVAIVSEMARHSTGTSEPLGKDQVLFPADVDDARYQ